MSGAYLPLADYAAIGDCHGAALVSRHGSVDWCCLERFDADPVFCALLDAQRGGALTVEPAGEASWRRAYLAATNVLRSELTTAHGRVAITDFMPVGRAPGASLHDYVSLRAPCCLVRVLEGIAGEVRLRLRYRPSRQFAARPAQLRATADGITSDDGATLHSSAQLTLGGDQATAELTLAAGDRQTLVVAPRPRPELLAVVPELQAVTTHFWREWAEYCRYDGPHRELVRRSALALKLLTYAPSGAIAAAPTTSLPEAPGGERNWDYRYCWLRDASFTLYALAALGYSGEARRFMEFVGVACRASYPRLQIMYGVGGEAELVERELPHLAGYRGSRPVRTGNAAHDQDQLDVYGELLDWAYLQMQLGQRMSRASRSLLRHAAETIAAHWRRPDQGLWETRSAPRHHLHGKAMAWVGLDRAARMFPRSGGLASERDEVARDIAAHGVNPASGCLRRSYEEDGVDAALLLIPLTGFPLDREVLSRTVDRIRAELGDGPFLYRYRSEDGLGGREGAFLACSFWLVDALLLLDRGEEARAVFTAAAARANDVGLLAEEVDPASGELLGNFPQGLTHLALIYSATNLELYERRGAAALQGTHVDRARHVVEATAGWRGVWAAFKRTRRVGRLRSSRASQLGWA